MNGEHYEIRMEQTTILPIRKGGGGNHSYNTH